MFISISTIMVFFGFMALNDILSGGERPASKQQIASWARTDAILKTDREIYKLRREIEHQTKGYWDKVLHNGGGFLNDPLGFQSDAFDPSPGYDDDGTKQAAWEEKKRQLLVLEQQAAELRTKRK